MSLLDQIPGYREAVEGEARDRHLAFVPHPRTVAGVPVRPVTLRHLLALDAVGSPFVVGGDVTEEDVITTLWFVASDYKPGRPPAAFVKRIARMNLQSITVELESFFADAFADAPGTANQSGKIPVFSYAAGIIDLLASEYGWDDEKILDTPVRRLWQYLRAMELRKNPKASAVMFNPSDKVRGEWLRKQNENGQN